MTQNQQHDSSATGPDLGPWQTHSQHTVYENAWIEIREDQVTMPDGRPGIYGVVRMQSPAVFVVPVTDAGEIVLVGLTRYAIGRWSLEVPAGGSDGQPSLEAAQRELREETGLVADEWTRLGRTYALNGVADAPEDIWLARGLHPADDSEHHQAEEGIDKVVTVPFGDVLEMIADGRITDSETITAIALAGIELGRFN